MNRNLSAVRNEFGKPTWLAVNTGVQGTPLTIGPCVEPSVGQALKLARNPGFKSEAAPFG
jgi:hypothetical protein